MPRRPTRLIAGQRMQQLVPGAYADGDGALHVVVDELLEANGYANTPENRQALELAAREIFARELPGAPVTIVEGGE